MQTQELHIELGILLQKINSHYNQNLQPQEIDLFINREIVRFINRRLSRLSNRKQEGLFDTIKRTVELSPLIKTRSLPVMYSKDKKEAKVLLPFDFLYYISSKVNCCCPCLGNNLYPSYYYEYHLSLAQIIDADFSIEYKQGLYTNTIKKSDIPTAYFIEDSTPIYSNKLMLINAIRLLLEKKTISNIEITYNKLSNTIVFRSYESFSMKINGNEVQVDPIPYMKLEEIKDPLESIATVIDEEFEGNIKNSYLSGAKDEKSLVAIRDTYLDYTIKGVIGDKVKLTYLKKPAKIDLLLQCNSDLSEETLTEVIADTAQRIMGVIGSDNYAKFAQENILVE